MDLTKWLRRNDPARSYAVARRTRPVNDGTTALIRTNEAEEGGPSRVSAITLTASDAVVTMGVTLDWPQDSPSPNRGYDVWLSVHQEADGSVRVQAWSEGKQAPGDGALRLGHPSWT